MGDKVRFIDQTYLPGELRVVQTDDHLVVCEAIRALRIRGAPAIGVAAAFAVALALGDRTLASLTKARDAVRIASGDLASTRPTAVNLFAALQRVGRAAADPAITTVEQMRERVLQEALAISQEDVDACATLARLGATLIEQGSMVLTHCNTGALATAGEGTALGAIIEAHRQGKVTQVFVSESRPLLQGARLTAWELLRAGVPMTLITDSAASSVLSRGWAQAILVGADSIAANGDVANKVGTYPLAVLASRHGVPFYVVAPTTTLFMALETGKSIVIEERSPEEVTHFGGQRIAPEGTRVFNPAFDVTPNELVTAIVTERGILRPPYEPGLRLISGRGEN